MTIGSPNWTVQRFGFISEIHRHYELPYADQERAAA